MGIDRYTNENCVALEMNKMKYCVSIIPFYSQDVTRELRLAPKHAALFLSYLLRGSNFVPEHLSNSALREE